jgi:hypothetical protein
VKRTTLFIILAPLALAALLVQAIKLRDLRLPTHEMWE